MDHRAIGDRDAGADHHERLDGDVAAEGGIGREKNRLRRDQRHAGVEGRLAQTRLHHLFGLGQLSLGVDAAHFVFAGFDHDSLQSHVPHDGNRVGQIIFAFAVGIADLVDDAERPAAIERHHAGVAEIDLAFGRAGVGMLADRHQMIALDQQAAVAGGVGGAKAEHGERRTVYQRRPQPRKSLRRNQRRIAEHDQQIIGAARQCLAGRQHSVRGAETFTLHEGRGIRALPPGLLRDVGMVRSDHHGERGAGTFGRCGQHMRQQRLAGDRMQHLWHRRPHARALAGREHDGEAGSNGHCSPCIEAIILILPPS